MLHISYIVFIALLICEAYCIRMKRSANDQQTKDCYGTACSGQNNQNDIIYANIPEIITEAVVNSIPEKLDRHEKQLQSMVNIMENMIQLLDYQFSVLNEKIHVTVPPEDCQDVFLKGLSTGSGVYTITPRFGLGSLQVYCDMEDGAWTVFQKRFNGSVDFHRNWTQYENGFGSAEGEYWLGLRHIYLLTKIGTWEMRVDLESFDGDTAYALYDSFMVESAASNYALRIDGYSGTAGDSLERHNGKPFSTKDRDNDYDSRHCAQVFGGAWWYYSCMSSNLNAFYLGPTGVGITANLWYGFKETRSLKGSEMKIRRVR